MTEWTETYRGSVAPWECDVTEHFTIAFYFDRLGEATPALADALGIAEIVRAGFPRRLDVRFARELRAGAGFHIDSAVLGIDTAELRLGHRVVDSVSGEPVTWVQETWGLAAMPLTAARRSAIAAAAVTWPGPATEKRPEPGTSAGLIPTARGRAKPADLDENGLFSLAAIVHRFTTSSLHMQAAIGMNAEYMARERRGFSTFELALRIGAAPPRLGEPFLVEAGVAHLGSSSVRFAHRLCDPRDGREIARLGQFGVQLDLDARRPAALPPALREQATRLLLPTG